MTVQMFTTCPDCGQIAEIRDQFVLDSTEGPIEHVLTFCVDRHWFQLPTANLERVSALVAPVACSAPTDRTRIHRLTTALDQALPEKRTPGPHDIRWLT